MENPVMNRMPRPISQIAPVISCLRLGAAGVVAGMSAASGDGMSAGAMDGALRRTVGPVVSAGSCDPVSGLAH